MLRRMSVEGILLILGAIFVSVLPVGSSAACHFFALQESRILVSFGCLHDSSATILALKPLPDDFSVLGFGFCHAAVLSVGLLVFSRIFVFI